MVEVFKAISNDVVVESNIALVLGGKDLSTFKDIKQRMLDNSLHLLLGRGTFNDLIDDIHVMRPLHYANSDHLHGYALNLIGHYRRYYTLGLSHHLHKIHHTLRQGFDHPPYGITELLLMPIILLQRLSYLSEVSLQPFLPYIVPKRLLLHLYVVAAILSHDELILCSIFK